MVSTYGPNLRLKQFIENNNKHILKYCIQRFAKINYVLKQVVIEKKIHGLKK